MYRAFPDSASHQVSQPCYTPRHQALPVQDTCQVTSKTLMMSLSSWTISAMVLSQLTLSLPTLVLTHCALTISRGMYLTLGLYYSPALPSLPASMCCSGSGLPPYLPFHPITLLQLPLPPCIPCRSRSAMGGIKRWQP